MIEKDGQEKKITAGKNETAWWQPAVTMFLKLSAWIAVPIIIGLFIGKWLDSRFNSSPWLFLLSIGAAFLISIIGLVKNTMAELKRIDEQGKGEKQMQKK